MRKKGKRRRKKKTIFLGKLKGRLENEKIFEPKLVSKKKCKYQV